MAIWCIAFIVFLMIVATTMAKKFTNTFNILQCGMDACDCKVKVIL